MGEGPAQQKALIGPEDTTSFTGGFDTILIICYLLCQTITIHSVNPPRIYFCVEDKKTAVDDILDAINVK